MIKQITQHLIYLVENHMMTFSEIMMQKQQTTATNVVVSQNRQHIELQI